MADTVTEFGVYVRDAGLQTTGIVERFESLRTREVLHDEGSWVLELAGWSPEVELLRQPGAGITVRDDRGRVMFGGPCLRERVSYTQRDGQKLLFSGADDNVWLTRSAALPAPLVADPALWTVEPAHDVHTGASLTSLLRAFVQRQIGSTALPARQVPLLGLAPDPVAGPTTVDIRARFDSLMSHIAQAVAGWTIVAWIRQSGEDLIFTAKEGITRPNVLFSPELGELEYDFERAAPEATAVYVAGAGELSARLVRKVEQAPPAEWPWRFEANYDQRSEDDPAALVAAGESFLTERAAQQSLKLDASDVPWIVRKDFDLGDWVTVLVDTRRFLEQVRAVDVSYSPDGRVGMKVSIGADLVIGRDPESQFAGLFAAGRRTSARLSSVEAQ